MGSEVSPALPDWVDLRRDCGYDCRRVLLARSFRAMRTARTALLITTLLTLAVLMAGCTLPGSEEPPDLSELVSPTPQEEEGPTPEVIEVTPLGERPGAPETPFGTDIEAQELGEPTEAPETVEEEEPPAGAVQPTVTPAPAAPAEELAENIPAAGAILFVREGQ